MQIAVIENNAVARVGDYREVFPNTSFPASGPSDEWLAENGAKKVNLFKEHDRDTQRLEACDAYDDGDFVSVVQVVDLNDDELAAISAGKAVAIRAQRAEKLKACDWTQVADAPVDQAAWATYRQALRDITAQPGFPTTVEWPHDPDWVEGATPF